MFDLEGKTALVTGASGGIGRGVALALHAQGANVAITGRRRDALDELASELAERVHVAVADFTVHDAVESLAGDVRGALGPTDILVNNAGVTGDVRVGDMSDAQWQAMIDVNLTAVFRLCRAFVGEMRTRKWGRIIGIGSILGATGCPGEAHYSASKAGLIGFSKSLAAEVAAEGVTVNCIAPGYIRTPMMDEHSEQKLAELLSRIPVGFFGQPEDVGAAVVYLASDEARFVTGETIHANGGMAMI